ncbi:MAG TPA: ABC transporter ATP-binding protein [Solirubrobacter sp.]|nr:ABC transporter ATP-binding protein [Solirubrobacter sp.]
MSGARAQPVEPRSKVDTPATLLEVDGLRCGRGAADAVVDFSLTVRAGETVALLGPNGAGKSTAVDGICGLVDRRGGSVRFDGRDITRARGYEIARLGLIQVSQERDLFPGMRVIENLELGAQALARRKRSERDHREWVLDLFPRLRERADQKAGSLSGGEQQMLAIARALMGQPRILLLDEPTAGLAPIVVEQLAQVLQQLAREGLTLVLVEQNVRVALDSCERFVVLRDGRIVFDGDRTALGADPRQRLGRLFISTIAS